MISEAGVFTIRHCPTAVGHDQMDRIPGGLFVVQDRREHVLRTERTVDRQIILPQDVHHRVARLFRAEPEGRRRADHHSHPNGHGGAVAHREAAAGLDPVAERVAKIEQLPLPAVKFILRDDIAFHRARRSQ